MYQQKSNVPIVALIVAIANCLLAQFASAQEFQENAEQRPVSSGVIRTFGSSKFQHNTSQAQLARGQNVILCEFYGVHAEFSHFNQLSPLRLIA